MCARARVCVCVQSRCRVAWADEAVVFGLFCFQMREGHYLTQTFRAVDTVTVGRVRFITHITSDLSPAERMEGSGHFFQKCVAFRQVVGFCCLSITHTDHCSIHHTVRHTLTAKCVATCEKARAVGYLIVFSFTNGANERR